MKIEIRKPITPKEWDDYYNMRYNILRKPLNQPLGSERNDGDLAGQHFALYENKIIRAIARLDKSGEGISQVRFVAVNTESRGKGFGKLIMNALEVHSENGGNTKMILHARDYAVDFYLKLGYTKIDKSYKLYDVLQHYLMEKIY